MAQRAVTSPVNTYVQKGRWLSLSVHGELIAPVVTVKVGKEVPQPARTAGLDNSTTSSLLAKINELLELGVFFFVSRSYLQILCEIFVHM
jgi:hypothetical protein